MNVTIPSAGMASISQHEISSTALPLMASWTLGWRRSRRKPRTAALISVVHDLHRNVGKQAWRTTKDSDRDFEQAETTPSLTLEIRSTTSALYAAVKFTDTPSPSMESCRLGLR
jgi:hypothetical protein